ncbi:MAG: glycosyltransferase [Candidatus Palauibacterales bacterium]|nr:glycosyltransferase [Candidatus Palauibacterales bacterium]
MSGADLKILHVNTHDTRGGAAQAAWRLHRAYAARGITSWMAVKRKGSDDPGVFEIPNEQNRPWPARVLRAIAGRMGTSSPLARATARTLRRVAEPARFRDIRRGVEDFHFPGSWKLFDLLPESPDLVHCHNLHGGYFDLRALSMIAERAPVVLFLHDAWLLSGHCAYSFGCERWKTGCGECPDLTIHPAVQADATDYNWRRKRDIFSKASLHVATPSRWLMDRVEASMLAPAVRGARVIPLGIDLSVFHPGDTRRARMHLGVPRDARVVLLAADGIRANSRKDFATARAAVAEAAERLAGSGGELVLLALGESSDPVRIGNATVRFVPFQDDPSIVAEHYRAADLYLHTAREDNFPCTVLEALACGTPVVATAVGGVPEQVRSLTAVPGIAAVEEETATGMLVPPGDPDALSAAIVRLLADGPLRTRLAENAAREARSRFDVERYADDFVAWYGEILREGRPTGLATKGGPPAPRPASLAART